MAVIAAGHLPLHVNALPRRTNDYPRIWFRPPGARRLYPFLDYYTSDGWLFVRCGTHYSHPISDSALQHYRTLSVWENRDGWRRFPFDMLLTTEVR